MQLDFESLEQKTREKIRSVKVKVEELLEKEPATRESYKELVWQYWETYDMKRPLSSVTKGLFMNLTNPLTIIRCGTKIRDEREELRPKDQQAHEEMENAYRKEMR